MENIKWYNSESEAILKKGYLLKGETIHDAIHRIASRVASRFPDKPELYDNVTESIVKGWQSLSSPIWANLGTERGYPISCFNVHVSDSMESVSRKVSEVIMQTKHGGGTSAFFDMREKGAPITNNGESNGPVAFMKIFDAVTDKVSQGGTRKGAFAAYMSINHPDILEFIKIKSVGSDLQSIFTGVVTDDEFMHKLDVLRDKEAMTLWAKILESRQQKGIPYIMHGGNANRNKPEIYKKLDLEINASNLCMVGSDRVVSDRGYLTAEELYEQGGELILFDGEKPVKSSEMKLREENAGVFKVTLENGMTHTVTDYHGMAKMDERGKITRTRLKDLKVGDYIGVQTKKGLFGGNEMKDEAFLLGAQQLKNENVGIPNKIWQSTEISQIQYLKGLFNYEPTNESLTELTLKHSNLKFLEDLQKLLSNLGIYSKVGHDLLENEYYLIINNNSKKRQKVVSIEFVGYENVYCPTIYNDEHIFVANGLLTFNCSEIMLPSTDLESFICCLASMNLELYDEWKDTHALETALYTLDAVLSDFIDKTKDAYGFEASHRFAVRHRAVGIGVMGYHSYLQKNNIPFESEEARTFNRTVFKFMREKLDQYTEDMAVKYGPAPIYNEVPEGEIVKRRHTVTMAVAPTTSSSAILGQVSAGIEPFSSNYYKVGLAKGNFIRINKHLKKVLASHGMDNKETWDSIKMNKGSVQHLPHLTEHEKNVFKTFREISQKEIVVQACGRQHFIDQGQSLNLNIPADLPIKDVHALMMDGYYGGIKAFYYQRSQSVSKEMISGIVKCGSCES